MWGCRRGSDHTRTIQTNHEAIECTSFEQFTSSCNHLCSYSSVASSLIWYGIRTSTMSPALFLMQLICCTMNTTRITGPTCSDILHNATTSALEYTVSDPPCSYCYPGRGLHLTEPCIYIKYKYLTRMRFSSSASMFESNTRPSCFLYNKLMYSKLNTGRASLPALTIAIRL